MVAAVLAWLVVVLHVLFALMETVGWDRMGRSFGYSRQEVDTTRALALNQGFYNAGLACVLAWALVTGQAPTVLAMLVYVVAMAIVGAVSARWTIFVVQGVPALLAFAAAVIGL